MKGVSGYGMNRVLLAFVVSLMSLNTIELQAQTPSPSVQCKVGRQATGFGFWTWRRNANVKVYVVAADFKRDEIPYLLKPLQNWTAVSETTTSGVSFEYHGTVLQQRFCENCLTLMRGTVFDKSRRHATELRAYSAQNDQLLTYAAIVIDPALTNVKALTNAIAHELGHTLGLLDCYTCKEKTTVMSQFRAMNVSNEMEGPSFCDVAQVRAAYQELTIRVGPSPANTGSSDEGEEPIDDDTPVVIRKP